MIKRDVGVNYECQFVDSVSVRTSFLLSAIQLAKLLLYPFYVCVCFDGPLVIFQRDNG